MLESLFASLLGESHPWIDGTSPELRKHSVLQVGVFDAPGINAVAGNGGTNLPAGTLLTLNIDGAFFNSRYTTDNGRIQGGTDLAKGFILIYELATSMVLKAFRTVTAPW